MNARDFAGYALVVAFALVAIVVTTKGATNSDESVAGAIIVLAVATLLATCVRAIQTTRDERK